MPVGFLIAISSIIVVLGICIQKHTHTQNTTPVNIIRIFLIKVFSNYLN